MIGAFQIMEYLIKTIYPSNLQQRKKFAINFFNNNAQ